MSSGIPTRLVQLSHPDEGRRAAVIYGSELHLLATYRSIYSFTLAALETGWNLRDLLSTDLSGIVLDYDEVHSLDTPWRFLPSFDQPEEPGRCLVSSATNIYRGYGAMLRAHGDPLELPPRPAAPGDIAAVYVIAPDGTPRRVGVTPANGCAIGPELALEIGFPGLAGEVRVTRAGQTVCSQTLPGGDVPLPLALAAIEPDHFGHDQGLRLGDVHVLFFGERLFGRREPLAVEHGDEIRVEFPSLGRALQNPVHVQQRAAHRVAALPL